MQMDNTCYTMLTVLGTNLVTYLQRGILLTITNPEHENGEGAGWTGGMTISRTRHQGKLVSADSQNAGLTTQIPMNQSR